MLERIAEIQGIGLMHQANGKPHTCQRATLIYSDNARGKSTLAAILRSASSGDASLVNAYKTIDGTLPPKVELQFGSGHKVTYENGAWSEKRPELVVFDADFVGRNVHSGGEVSTDHRKNLLEFALGEAAVVARAAVDSAAAVSKAAADKVQGDVAELAKQHPGMTLAQFESLANVVDVDVKLEDLQKRLIAANNIAAINAKPVPKAIAEPVFDITSLFEGLAESLKDVHADAEKVVRQHVAKLGSKGVESWLSQGRQFTKGNECPYCDQDISANDLVKSYQTHFNLAYAELKKRVAALATAVDVGASPTVVDAFAKAVAVAAAQSAGWGDYTSAVAIDFDELTAGNALTAFRDFVTELVQRKQMAPAEPVGSSAEREVAVKLWEEVQVPIRAANAAIKSAEGAISKYKTQLSGDNAALLQQQISQLQAVKRRHDPSVIAMFATLAASRASAASAEKGKKAAREHLDKLMTATLSKYQTSINALLKDFGASFSIKGMSANFRGNSPRTEYGLLLRGKDVAIDGDVQSFSTVLSEGDKRTLAFAFFVASALEDPKLPDRIVVIDDPMCSLDLNRRHHTRAVLKKLHAKSAQLIVLAHDHYFLRDMRDGILKQDKTASIATFRIVLAPNNYSNFAHIDLDKECESDYARHHRALIDFSGGGGGDQRAVAKSIRPMLEGYLHRRFPGLLSKDLLFGQAIVQIRDSQSPSPLCYAKNITDELTEINDYAGQFHHDTNPDSSESIAISSAELKTYVDRALSVVHKGTP